jgi:signal transduction histidine kinase
VELKKNTQDKKVNKIIKKIVSNIRQLESENKIMRTGCQLLGFYVQDLLDLAQIRAGTVTKNFEMTNVNEPLLDIIDTQ